jgi:hypothetical protein
VKVSEQFRVLYNEEFCDLQDTQHCWGSEIKESVLAANIARMGKTRIVCRNIGGESSWKMSAFETKKEMGG